MEAYISNACGKNVKKASDGYDERERLWKKAKRLVESATGKKTVRHDGHGPGQAPHYQPKNGGGAHVRVPGAHLTEGMGLFGDAIDFFNPLSDAQDLIDLVQDVVESFD